MSPTDLIDYHATGERVPPAGFSTWLPQLEELADVQELVFAPDGAGDAGLVSSDADLLQLAACVQRLIQTDGTDAVVVTHGTNGLEESALFLWASQVVPPGKRVVVTGAMRPASAMSSDGPRNLWAAVLVGVDPGRPDVGVCTVLDDEILAGDVVVKRHTTALSAFRAAGAGVLGTVGPDSVVRWTMLPVEAAPEWLKLGLREADRLAEVPAIASWTGDGGARYLRDLHRAPPAAVIVIGRGNGHPRPEEIELLSSLSDAGTVVCIASRVADGWVHVPAIGRAKGWLSTGPRRWWAARLLLSAALAKTDDPTALQELLWGVGISGTSRTEG